jgi:hypothetical protein
VVGILEPGAARPTPPEQSYEPEELAHIMPWAHDIQQEAPEEGAPRPRPDESAPGLPPWLRDAELEELQAPAPVAGQPQAPPVPPLEELEDIEPFVPPDMVPVPAGEQPSAPAHRPAEQVPDWLKSIAPAAVQGAQAAPTAGPQEQAVERVAVPEAGTATPAPSMPYEVEVEPIERRVAVRAPRPGALDALSNLLQQPPESAHRRAVVTEGLVLPALVAETRARRRTPLQWLLPDGLIYLLVLATLLAVLIVRPPFGVVNPPPASGVQQFFDAIESVPDDRPVLLAYDWDATRSAEMSMLSRAVMHHLMSLRLRFVTVSTSPQGPGFAQQITDSIANDPRANYGYQYGREYLVLGYLPGNEAALKALVSDFNGALPLDYVMHRRVESFQLLQSTQIQGLSDFALIIALSSDEAELRNWIEQVSTRTNVPIIAAVPQSLEPFARPYLGVRGAGLKAVISGPTDAVHYLRQLELRGRITAVTGTQRGNISTTLADRLNAQSVAQLLVAVVIAMAIVGLLTKSVLRR